MLLKKENLRQVDRQSLEGGDERLFDLPERVIQFGTGVLLRGLPDYFIDKANAEGIFNGRIVVVKSTDRGSTDAFKAQDNLYTLCLRGYEKGQPVKENRICSAISRVLSASDEWHAILDCAADPEIDIVISNTTESGIKLVEDDVNLNPPVSFPGKLLSFLLRRYQAFNGSGEHGMVIVPTELIPENGKKLESVLVELALQNSLDGKFIHWLEAHNYFCNSLVDRIVPGKPEPETLSRLHADLGYQDDLLIMAEPYKLWAIEAPAEVKDILSFHSADSSVVIEPDIDKYRELKLRLLNGSHTFCCGLAFRMGFRTVAEAMADESFLSFITGLIFEEIVPSIPYAMDVDEKRKFGQDVLDRFRNPNIAHQWHSITLNYSSKMKVRNVPLVLHYYKTFNQVPERFALGFAGYISFMKPVQQKDGLYFGQTHQGELYPIHDEKAGYFKSQWDRHAPEVLVREILKDQLLWGEDLNALPGFCEAVTEKLLRIEANTLELKTLNFNRG